MIATLIIVLLCAVFVLVLVRTERVHIMRMKAIDVVGMENRRRIDAYFQSIKVLVVENNSHFAWDENFVRYPGELLPYLNDDPNVPGYIRQIFQFHRWTFAQLFPHLAQYTRKPE